MMTRSDKEILLKEVVEEAKGAKALVFSDYKGVTVKDLSALRAELRKSGSRFKILKKTILDIALREAGIAAETRKLEGQIGVAFSPDEVSAAKTIADFIKGKKDLKLTIAGGALEGKSLTAEEVKALAKLPSKDELRGVLAGTLQAPIASFARVLQGNIAGFVRVLDAVAESRK
ncbi:MAG: 50S ribosomal protein L10 [Candidatus Moranbacteria bacterium]|nr:50S ribosomal protein L10 [Candidatus Moranbacteria bacterium]